MMRTIVPGLFGGPFSSSPPIPSPADALGSIIPWLGLCGIPVFKLKGAKVEFDEEGKGIANPKPDFPPLPLATGRETPGTPPPIPIPPILSPLLLPGLALGRGGKEYGNSNQNILPLPNSLSTPNRPPESLTICRTRARPRPEPLPPCRRPISVWT